MHQTSRHKPFAHSILLLTLLTLTLTSSIPMGDSAQSENTWEHRTPKTETEQIYRVVGADGKIYIYQSYFSCYDPSTNNYTKKAQLKIPFEYERKGDYCFYTAVALQNEIYVIGGAHSAWRKLDFTFIRIYNTSDDSWTNGTATDYDIELFPIANAVDGKIYLLDGRSGRLGILDPASNNWTAKTSLPFWYFTSEPYPLVHQSTVVNDRIYYFIDAGDGLAPHMAIYDTKTDNWLPSTNPPLTESQVSHYKFAFATTGRFAPQRIYYIGAEAQYPTDPAFSYAYDPANDSWSTAEPPSISTLGYDASAILDDNIYYFAVNGSSVEVYTPIGYSITPLPPSPSPIYPQANPIPKTNPLLYAHLAIGAIIAVISVVPFAIYLRKHRGKIRLRHRIWDSLWNT
jgi:hypothetical protein